MTPTSTRPAAPPRPVAARAHAKINLDLRVLGTRPDGYHELRTVFQAIDLHDDLECHPHDGPLVLDCETPGVPLDRGNLVWRAAEALWEAIGRTGPVEGVRIRLVKRIPVQAGLGGGSTDAAATLTALSAFWRLQPGQAPLGDVAARLGADVPFFLAGGTALGLGRGDEIYPLVDLPKHIVLLLVPGFGVSSREAFGWYDAEREAHRGAPPREPQVVPGPWPSRAAQMVNDLEAAIARHHPEIEQMRLALRRAGARAAAMSGSGSTVFGLFQQPREAARAVAELAGTGWRVLRTASLGREEYARLSRPRPLRQR